MGHWIKNSIDADSFDSDQVKERFDPATFKKINKALAQKATDLIGRKLGSKWSYICRQQCIEL